MKLRTPWITLIGAGALLVAGQAMARQTAPAAPADTPADAPAPAASAAAPATTPALPAPTQAVFQTAQGEVTVRSVPPSPVPVTQAPPFEQLSGGGKWISTEQANAYPLLANDFDYADSNRDQR